MEQPNIIKQHVDEGGDLWGKCENGYVWQEGGAAWNPVEWEDLSESAYLALEGPTGVYPPGKCQCGETAAEICCTFATYPDGSTDHPTCSKCCNVTHLPLRSYEGDLVDAKLD